jgi:hypothetical protein
MNQSKVSRLETARQVPTVAEAGAGARAYLDMWGSCEDAVFDEDARDLLHSLAQEFLAE